MAWRSVKVREGTNLAEIVLEDCIQQGDPGLVQFHERTMFQESMACSWDLF